LLQTGHPVQDTGQPNPQTFYRAANLINGGELVHRRNHEGAIMPDEVTPQRVAAIAAASRVPLDQASAARVANAVNPTVMRFAAQNIALPLEVEPANYAVVARRGMITK
jgi:hypothetical protein